MTRTPHGASNGVCSSVLDSVRVWPAVSIASRAAEALARCGGAARVHSVFARSFNIALDNDSLITVVKHGRGGMPCAILVGADDSASFEQIIEPESEVRVASDALMIPAAGVCIDLHKAAVISYRRSTVVKANAAALRAGVEAASDALIAAATGEGLTPLLACVEELAAGRCSRTFTDALCARGAAAICTLMNGLRDDDQRAIIAGVNGLCGLGIGLTPSGDDVLTGLTGTLAALGRLRANDALAVEILRCAPTATTAVAAAYLEYAAHAEVSDILGEFIGAIASAERMRISAAAADLGQMGSTSGGETALGVLLAFHHLNWAARNQA